MLIAGNPTPLHTAICNEITRWLSPIDGSLDFNPAPGHASCTKFLADLAKMADAFTANPNHAVWSFDGPYTGPGRRPKLALAFGHAETLGGGDIRLNHKMFLLPDAVAAGVMVHEASHAVLQTQDIKYELGSGGYYSVLNTRNVAQDERYKNADNWRMFYQKIRQQTRPFDT